MAFCLSALGANAAGGGGTTVVSRRGGAGGMRRRCSAEGVLHYSAAVPLLPAPCTSASSRRRPSVSLPAASALATGLFGASAAAFAGAIGCRPRSRRSTARRGTVHRRRAALGASSGPRLDDFGEGCAFYINLARRPDRAERLLQTLGRANSRLLSERLERIDAVDGRDMRLHFDSGTVWSVVEPRAVARKFRAERLGLFTVVHYGQELLHFNNHMTDGGIACAMSHKKALERAARHPTADWALILEDDIADVVPNLDQALANVLAKLPQDWGSVLLGFHDGWGRVADPGPDEVADIDVYPTISHDFGLYAWMVRTDVARLIVDHAFPVSGQVDKAITGWLVQQGFRTYKVDPLNMLFHSPKSEESQDSDVQSLGGIEQIVENHGSVEAYNQHITSEREMFWERGYYD